ncbi:MAG TPA: type II and III secretion system protein family protein, partial [Acetobacteraceae bacterium]|nr:type II and III secretion system protein family protein [Acetobacteraceae bacterium]
MMHGIAAARALMLGSVMAFSTVSASRAAPPPAKAPTAGSGTITIEAGSGRLLNLNGAAANVFIADPKVAEVRPASPGTLFVFGVGPGRTTIAAVDAAGQALVNTQVVVRPSSFAAAQAQALAAQAVPGGRVNVQPSARGLLVTGQVDSPAEAAKVLALVRSNLAEGQSVEDHLGVRSSTQVLLRVRIAEMSRTVTRNLGINWQALGTAGRFSAGLATGTTLASTLTSGTLSSLTLGTPDVNAIIDALAQDNLARILAEPNLTAMSGQPASFLAGGEFPIPVGQQNSQTTIEFKQYGVKLTFVPTVLSSGRINLHVSPEVSELTTEGAVQLRAGSSSLQIPALSVRRAETTVEVGSGESFAIAGLLQNSVQHESNGVPIVGDIPILGALFRADNYQRKETELVVVVTPYIAQPVSSPTTLHLP